MLKKQLDELRRENQQILEAKQQVVSEKQEILISHSKEVVALRQEIMDLKILKQRKEVLQADLQKEKQKSEERRRELEEERRKRRSAEKWVKEMESQMTGKPIDKLEAQKRERVSAAKKQKDKFREKLEVTSSLGQKRRAIDDDEWVVDRGVIIQKASGKRGKLVEEGGLKGKEAVKRDQGQANQEKSIVNGGGAEMDQKTGNKCYKLNISSSLMHADKIDNLLSATGDKERKGVRKRFIECTGCGMKASI